MPNLVAWFYFFLGAKKREAIRGPQASVENGFGVWQTRVAYAKSRGRAEMYLGMLGKRDTKK